MTPYIMSSEVINLPFKTKYAIYKTARAAFQRYNQLSTELKNMKVTQENRDEFFRLKNECHHILDTLEGFDI